MVALPGPAKAFTPRAGIFPEGKRDRCDLRRLSANYPPTSSRSSPASGLLCYDLPLVNPEKHHVFQKVDAYAGDPILSLMERFKEDPR
ncbi:hypothetical protein ACSSQN_022750, partial [Raoultella planticola]|uniref:hypothetical protein n=1 Tax=Raoultella planticola TaxID=575 RepID=UPI003FD763DD